MFLCTAKLQRDVVQCTVLLRVFVGLQNCLQLGMEALIFFMGIIDAPLCSGKVVLFVGNEAEGSPGTRSATDLLG